MLWEEKKIFRREDFGKGCNFKCIGHGRSSEKVTFAQTFEEEKMSQDYDIPSRRKN